MFYLTFIIWTDSEETEEENEREREEKRDENVIYVWWFGWEVVCIEDHYKEKAHTEKEEDASHVTENKQ